MLGDQSTGSKPSEEAFSRQQIVVYLFSSFFSRSCCTVKLFSFYFHAKITFFPFFSSMHEEVHNGKELSFDSSETVQCDINYQLLFSLSSLLFQYIYIWIRTCVCELFRADAVVVSRKRCCSNSRCRFSSLQLRS